MAYITWKYYSTLYDQVPEDCFDKLNAKASAKLDVYTHMRARNFEIAYEEETATDFHKQIHLQIQNTVCELINAVYVQEAANMGTGILQDYHCSGKGDTASVYCACRIKWYGTSGCIMSVLFTDTMTVYNSYCDTENEIWNRTVVKGVQWSHNKSEVSTSNGIQTENKVESITIDFDRAYANKPYLPPNEYRKLSAKECKGYWTLDAKTGYAVLILGVSDKEISTQYRLADLKKIFSMS